jgi:DNA repair exonuclease SbcCD ATPase subunit
VDEYLKQIEDLKNRLSDYEVIAEDIADLHKLREENQKLLAQVNSQSADVPAPVLNAVPAEEKVEAKVEAAQIQQPEMDQLLKDLSADLNGIETSEASEQDKDLIRQFEKSKGSSS